MTVLDIIKQRIDNKKVFLYVVQKDGDIFPFTEPRKNAVKIIATIKVDKVAGWECISDALFFYDFEGKELMSIRITLDMSLNFEFVEYTPENTRDAIFVHIGKH